MQLVADALTCGGRQQVSLAQQEIILGDQRVLPPAHGGDPQPSRHLELGNGHAVGSLSQTHVDDLDFSRFKGQMEVELLLDDLLEHHARDETGRRHIIDVEFLIGGFPEQIIEAGNRRRNHEDLFRQLHRHEVGVVGIRDGDERVGILDARFSQGLHVVRQAVVDRAVERGAQ